MIISPERYRGLWPAGRLGRTGRLGRGVRLAWGQRCRWVNLAGELCAGAGQPRTIAVPIRPSGGEPRLSRLVWNRFRVKPAPHCWRASSRSLMISSLPQV